MAKYVAAIDQGTTSTRCMIFNHSGEPVGMHQLEHEQIYPKAGWVEHDALEIWARTQDVVKGALKNAGAHRRGYRRCRRHQSTRDDRGLGQEYRQTLLQRHCLAGHAYGQDLSRRLKGMTGRIGSAPKWVCRWLPISPAPR